MPNDSERGARMKVYEALRRAEEERQPRTATDIGDSWHSAEGAAAPQWMPSPDSAGHPPEAHERVGLATDELAASRRRIALLEPDSFPTEQFRLLRSRLDSLAAESRLVRIAVTSANPGEGKSSVSINLAVVSAMSIARRVLLIDCDMRRPTIHRSFGLEPSFGLAEILLDRASPEQAILNVPGTRLDVLAVCIQPPNPSERQPLESACGHCSWCNGVSDFPLPERVSPPVSATVLEQARSLREAHGEALHDARALARLLCGVSSPRVSRARLTRNPLFGALRDVPFGKVLSHTEQMTP